MSQKLVSICVPAFNSEKSISETLESLINQSYQNIIIKVLDNCSEDRTEEIVRSFSAKDNRIQYIKNDHNLGGEGNFNRCVEVGEGDYLAVFHADDVYHSSIIEEQIAFLEQYPETAAVAVNANTINNAGKFLGKRFIPYELRQNISNLLSFEEFKMLTFKYGNFITCPSVMGRKEIFQQKVKGWRGELFKTSADLDVWFRFSQEGKFGFISKELMNYRVDDVSYSFNLKKVRTHRHDLFLVLDHYNDRSYQDNYNFLLFKDTALRALNAMKSKQKIVLEWPKISLSLLQKGLSSFWHFKFLIRALVIRVLSFFYQIKNS